MQKTAYEMRISDWSADVCSSDLRRGPAFSLTIDRVEFLAIDAQILRLAEELFGFGRRKTQIVGTQYQRLIVDDQPCEADLRQRAAAAEDREIVGQVFEQFAEHAECGAVVERMEIVEVKMHGGIELHAQDDRKSKR